MALKFTSHENDPKVILIYGIHGGGKSTFATQYCEKQDWSYCVIDVDNTNYTTDRILKIDLSGGYKSVYNNLISIIDEIDKDESIDTIIFDGVSSAINKLKPPANPRNQFAHHQVKSELWDKIIDALIKTHKHLIFIGQIDLEVYYTPDKQTSRPIRRVTEIANDIYKCCRTKEGKILPVQHVKSRDAKKQGTIVGGQ